MTREQTLELLEQVSRTNKSTIETSKDRVLRAIQNVEDEDAKWAMIDCLYHLYLEDLSLIEETSRYHISLLKKLWG